MKNLLSFNEFLIYESNSFKNDKQILEELDYDYFDDSFVLENFNVEEILAFYAVKSNSINTISEGFLSNLRDKMKAMLTAKADVSGAGSIKKKEAISAQVDKIKDAIQQAKDAYKDEKEQLEVDGFHKADDDQAEKAESEGFPPVKSIKNPDGENEYWIMGTEKIKNIFDVSVKKAKDKGMSRWKPKGDEKVPDKEKYEDIEGPINTPKGNTIFYVKKGEDKKNIGDEVQEYEEKINDLTNKIKELDKKIEDDFNGDSSDPGAEKIMAAQEKIRDNIKKLEAEKDKLGN